MFVFTAFFAAFSSNFWYSQSCTLNKIWIHTCIHVVPDYSEIHLYTCRSIMPFIGHKIDAFLSPPPFVSANVVRVWKHLFFLALDLEIFFDGVSGINRTPRNSKTNEVSPRCEWKKSFFIMFNTKGVDI